MDLVTAVLLVIFVALVSLPISGEVARVRKIARETRAEIALIREDIEMLDIKQHWSQERVDLIMEVCSDVEAHFDKVDAIQHEAEDLPF